MDKNVLVEKLPIGVIVTDNRYKIQYYNSFVAIKISSEIPLLEQELEKLVLKKKGKSNSDLTKLCLSINTQIFRVIMMDVKIDDLEESRNVFLLFEANAFFHFDDESDETNKLVNRLQSIIDFSYDGIYVTDHDGTTLCVNKSYERITGVKIDEVIGKNIRELEVQGMFSPIITPWVLEHRKRITVEQTVKAGKKVIITGNPVFEENGDIQYIITNVRDMTEINQLRAEVDRLKKQKKFEEENIVYGSAAMKNVMQTIAMVSDINISILLLGESGVGKGIIAKYIHESSNRKSEPFIALNCGALVPNLLESELFGYEAGAFTGALKKGKQGLFEIANKGVVFLDEIGDMSIELQGKLLRVLQEGEIQRVGGTELIPIDVRVICATNKNLSQMVAEGTFREDLYYRLDVITIEIPPLRQRKDDIALLIASYSERFNNKYGKNKIFTPEALNTLIEYRWPGNVRELRNLVEQLIVLTNEEKIDLMHLPTKVKASNNFSLDIAKIKPLRLLLAGAKGKEAVIFARFIHQTHCPDNPFIMIREEDYHADQAGESDAGELIAAKMIQMTAGPAGILFVENINRWDLNTQTEWLKQLHNIDLSYPHRKYHVIISQDSSPENAQRDDQLLSEVINCFRSLDLRAIIPTSNQTINQKKIKAQLRELELKYCTKKEISDKALSILTAYNWSGKEDELRTVLEQIVLEDDEYIDTYHLPANLIESFEGKTEPIEVHRLMPLKEAIESVERQLIELAIKKTKTTRRAASVLGITQSTFIRKRQKQITHQSET